MENQTEQQHKNSIEGKYEATLFENGSEVCKVSGTLMEMANWADNAIRLHGDCCVDIKQVSA